MEYEVDLEKIGKFICELRINKNYSQLDLARLIGVSYRTISKWENGGSFPDVLYQRRLCDILDISLYELQKGEYNSKERIKIIRVKKLQKLMIIILSILLPIFIFLSGYLVLHFNKYHSYEINASENAELNCNVSGIINETYKDYTIYIGNIDLKDYTIKDTDIISADLYSDDTLIYHVNEITKLKVKFLKSNKININNLRLVINIDEVTNKTHHYDIKLDLLPLNSFDNYKDISTKNILIDNSATSKLKKMGFNERKDSTEFIKEVNLKGIDKKIYFFINDKRIIYSELSNTIKKNIQYNGNSKILEVYIYEVNNDIHTLVEKYIYDYDTKKIDCKTNMCMSVDEVVKMMDEYVNVISVE